MEAEQSFRIKRFLLIFFPFFWFRTIDRRDTICWFLQSNLSTSEEHNVQCLSQGKLKVTLAGEECVSVFHTHLK